MARPSDWKPEEDALLTELWCSGVPAIIIVQSLPERTRNAIIGRVHRLRLERKVPDTGTGRVRVLIPQAKRQAPFRPKAPVVMLEPQLSFLPSPQDGITILELRRGLCRDVLDLHGAPDGLALYCGKRTIEGKSFCSYHTAIYYTPYSARRRAY